MPSILGFDEFRRRLWVELELPDIKIDRERHLTADLGFDSLQLFEIAILVEIISGKVIPSDIPIADLTLGELYHFYATATANPT